MFKKVFFFFYIIFIFSYFLSCSSTGEFIFSDKLKSNQDIRVLVKRNVLSIKVSTEENLRVIDSSSQNIIFNSNRATIIIRNNKVSNPIIIRAKGSLIALDGIAYRGYLKVINVDGRLFVINYLSMDEYLYSVVPSEIISSWNIEALKAQAVASRTFAIYHMLKTKKGSFYDLDSTKRFQVYNGVNAEKVKTSIAVDKTKDEIIVYNGKPILAFFHSTCGGRTIDDKFVWKGNDLPYLEGVKCNFCKESKYYNWKTTLTLAEIKKNVGKKFKNIGNIKKILFGKNFERVTEVTIIHDGGKIVLTGNNFRLLFPPKKIKSLFFSTNKVDGGLLLTGHGWGHGVGMCQWGAKGMSETGADYKAILNYYYKNINIVHYKSKNSFGNENKYRKNSNSSKRKSFIN